MRAHVTQERPARKAQSADVVVLTASICNAAGGPFLSRRSEAPLQVRSVGGSVSRLHCTTAQVLRSGASRRSEAPLQVRSVGGSVSRLYCTTAQVLRSGARSPEGPGAGGAGGGGSVPVSGPGQR